MFLERQRQGEEQVVSAIDVQHAIQVMREFDGRTHTIRAHSLLNRGRAQVGCCRKRTLRVAVSSAGENMTRGNGLN